MRKYGRIKKWQIIRFTDAHSRTFGTGLYIQNIVNYGVFCIALYMLYPNSGNDVVQ